MISTKLLKGVMAEARPIIERMLDDAEVIAGFRDVIAENGGDWSSLKALIKAQIQDERDDAGDGKRVRKILDRADYSAAYADMLGLGKMNELKNISVDTDFDPEPGEIIELPETATESGVGPDLGETAAKSPHEAVTSRERPAPNNASMAESVDAAGLKPAAFEHGGSNPSAGTIDDDMPDIPACLDRREKVLEHA